MQELILSGDSCSIVYIHNQTEKFKNLAIEYNGQDNFR
jgi:hypothetical protein